jgi:hypothetical protein
MHSKSVQEGMIEEFMNTAKKIITQVEDENHYFA